VLSDLGLAWAAAAANHVQSLSPYLIPKVRGMLCIITRQCHDFSKEGLANENFF